MKLHLWSKALAIAAVLATASPGLAHASGTPLPKGSQPPLRATGGDIFVTFLGESAAYRTELWFFGSLNPAPDQHPTGGTYLFANKPDKKVGDNSTYDGSAPLGSPTGNLNDPLFGGPFTSGSLLSFGLWVKTLDNNHGRWFYTGDVNIDDRVHAIITPVSGKKVLVGFEDKCKTGRIAADDPICYNDPSMSDWDYNDHMFLVEGATVSPEPVSMALMGTGLAGLAAMRRRRSRKDA